MIPVREPVSMERAACVTPAAGEDSSRKRALLDVSLDVSFVGESFTGQDSR